MAKANANLNNREKKRKQDEELTNQILIVFGLSLIMLLLLMFMHRLINNVFVMVPLVYGCGYAAIAFAVCAVAGFVYTAVLWKRDPDSVWLARTFTGSVIAVLLAGGLGLVRFLMESAFPVLYVALIAIAFLYLVFKIYQRDFFAQAVVAGFTSLLLYGFSRILNKNEAALAYVCYAAATLLLVGAIGLTYYLARHSGHLGKIKLLSHGANYKLLYATFLIMNAVLLVSLLLGVTVSFWAMVGVLGYLFVLAVYYTIKLM